MYNSHMQIRPFYTPSVFIVARSRLSHIPPPPPSLWIRSYAHPPPLVLQMCSRCTRSFTCGTRCYWGTRLSPYASAWPYCSSSGSAFLPMASTSASCCSLTCQVTTDMYYKRPYFGRFMPWAPGGGKKKKKKTQLSECITQQCNESSFISKFYI